MMDEKVSIIITCYNQQKFISETLKSVSDQTWQNWECIVVDDGSEDGSVKIINQFTEKDPRFRLIRQSNSGVSAARNTGFKDARGEFIQFLDGDDTLFTQKLEKQINCFQNHPDISICICDHQHHFLKENVNRHFKFEPLSEYPLEQILYRWQNGVAFSNHAPLYRRELWKDQELPFPEDFRKRNEDWIFNVLIALKGKKYFFLDEILCTYHITGKNFTANSLENASSMIHASIYLDNKLPVKYRDGFLDKIINDSLKNYVDYQKSIILHGSGNWKLGNALTKPFFYLFQRIKKLI